MHRVLGHLSHVLPNIAPWASWRFYPGRDGQNLEGEVEKELRMAWE